MPAPRPRPTPPKRPLLATPSSERHAEKPEPSPRAPGSRDGHLLWRAPAGAHVQAPTAPATFRVRWNLRCLTVRTRFPGAGTSRSGILVVTVMSQILRRTEPFRRVGASGSHSNGGVRAPGSPPGRAPCGTSVSRADYQGRPPDGSCRSQLPRCPRAGGGRSPSCDRDAALLEGLASWSLELVKVGPTSSHWPVDACPFVSDGSPTSWSPWPSSCTCSGSRAPASSSRSTRSRPQPAEPPGSVRCEATSSHAPTAVIPASTATYPKAGALPQASSSP